MGIINTIKESLAISFKEFIREIEKEFSRAFLSRINYIKKQIIKELISLTIILIALGLLAVSAIFFLIEYFYFNKTISFLIIGMIILVIGMIIKITN